jgi:3-isopropylmalate dehydrogenase
MGQAAHGSAPDIAGRNIANPFSQVLSAAMLLAWHASRHDKPHFWAASQAMEKAVSDCVASGDCTRDIGGRLGTRETGEALCRRLQVA